VIESDHTPSGAVSLTGDPETGFGEISSKRTSGPRESVLSNNFSVARHSGGTRESVSRHYAREVGSGRILVLHFVDHFRVADDTGKWKSVYLRRCSELYASRSAFYLCRPGLRFARGTGPRASSTSAA